MLNLTVVICTHNRADLLILAIDSIYSAKVPSNCKIDVLVVANACTDDTLRKVSGYQNHQGININCVEELKPGKSHALNHAISLVNTGFLCFVDDDQKVDKNYFVAIEQSINAYPNSNIFCGPIYPDWTGQEPSWVHESGEYEIYPPPIPIFDLGFSPLLIKADDNNLPGGGTLLINKIVFDKIGFFSETLGPRGHNLLGSEDTEFILRALAQGETIQYIPEIIQYHYVDTQRLKLGYLVKKCYQRNRSITMSQNNPGQKLPRYLWVKLAIYFFNLLLSYKMDKFRFFALRTSGILGQIAGHLQTIMSIK
jgi:GT2 family glycosyltransferase